jgi:hypothetical protein
VLPAFVCLEGGIPRSSPALRLTAHVGIFASSVAPFDFPLGSARGFGKNGQAPEAVPSPMHPCSDHPFFRKARPKRVGHRASVPTSRKSGEKWGTPPKPARPSAESKE